MIVVAAAAMANAIEDSSCGLKEGSCDQTSLIQVKQAIELGSQRSIKEHEQDTEGDGDGDAGAAPNLTAVMAGANSKVAAANEMVWQAASDEKMAHELNYVEKFATEVAEWKQKAAQTSADEATAKTYQADRQNQNAKHDAMERVEFAKEQAARKAAAAAAYANAKKLADAATMASVAREDAFYNATQSLKAQEAAYQATKAQAMRQAIMDEAAASQMDAKDAADAAATARGVMEAHAEAAAEAEYFATLNATMTQQTNLNTTEMVKVWHQAEQAAVKAATENLISQKKAAAEEAYKGKPVDYSSVIPAAAPAAAAAASAGTPPAVSANTAPHAQSSSVTTHNSFSIPTL